MFCNQCGKEIGEGVTFCPDCGASQGVAASETPNVDANAQAQQSAYQQPVNNQPAYQQNAGQFDSGTTSFIDAIKLFFTNYANFTGRTTKSEFWWAYLFAVLVNIAAGYIPYIGAVISLAMIVPSISLAIRRLHDTGKPWTYYLFGLIPIAGIIILIIQWCKDSDNDNQWGPARR